MSAQPGLIPMSEPEHRVASLLTETVDLFAFEGVYEAVLSEAAKTNTDPLLPPTFGSTMAEIGDETLANVYAEAASTIEYVVAPLRWAQDVLRAELARRMEERRGDGTGTIEIPHPSVEISSTPEWNAYEHDVDQIAEGLRGLPDDEIQKLLRTEPARSVSAYNLSETQLAAVKFAVASLKPNETSSNAPILTALESLLETRNIPETTTIRNTSSLQAWLRKNAGSTRAKIVASAITRTQRGTKVVIRPKVQPKRVEPLAAPVAINGAK